MPVGHRQKAAARAAKMNPRWSRAAIRSFPFSRTPMRRPRRTGSPNAARDTRTA